MKHCRTVVFCLIVVTCLFTAGCHSSSSVAAGDNGLVINSIIYSLGGDLERSLVSYTVSLWNKAKTPIEVVSITPVISEI